MKKVVLAFSGGLDTSYCAIYLSKDLGYEVHTITVNTGGFNAEEVKDIENIIIAYEPVWAIGTGLTATPDQAQEMHKYIRGLVKEKYSSSIAENITILYGGSCKASNAVEIFSKPDVDGGLIGGASLKKEDFIAIVEAV